MRLTLTRRLIVWISLGGIATSVLLSKGSLGIGGRFEKNKLVSSIKPVLAEGHFADGRTPAQALLELPEERLRSLAALAELQPQEQLRRIYQQPGRLRYDAFVHAITLAAVRDVNTVAPLDAMNLVFEKLSEIPDTQRLELLGLLATNALGTAQPDLASEFLRLACRTTASTWDTVKDMARHCRFTHRQPFALEDFRVWMSKRGNDLTADQHKEALALQYTLGLESNLPGEALEACLTELQAAASISDISAELMERTHRAAVLAERTKDILPWIESYLASFPEATLSSRELLKSSPSDSYKLWLKRAADLADGNQVAEKACAHHQRLLALGDTTSLDRLLPLSEQLGHGEETANLLQATTSKKGGESPLILTARVAALNGKTEQAVGMFEEWIAEHPSDRNAGFEFACFMEASADGAKATAAFEHFLRTFPNDAAAVKKLAALRIRQGQHESALRELDGLAEADFDAETLSSYTTLAESLGRPGSLERALRIASRDEKAITPALYIRMSEIAREQPDEEAPVKVLREGLARLPQSPSLHVKLASLLLEQEQYDEALNEALHPAVKGRFDAITLALAAGIHTPRCAEVMAAVGADFEKRYDLTTSARLDLAAACCITGDAQRGKKLFATVPAERANFARLAAAHLLAGHLEEAEIFARQNIAHSTLPKPSDWILLGDAQSKLGLEVEANDAYAKALSVVSRKIARHNAPGTVASETTGDQPVTQR